ncbi:MAG: S26 family signal peptidase [Phycisphaerales bacterium]|nr:S26 family signal peptidase [Hyphomonadaceae bacterium]
MSIAALASSAPDVLLYNHSPSIAVGLYLRVDGPIAPGTVVTVRASDVAPVEAHARGFDDRSDRFIKHVGATAGEHVCGGGESLSVDGVVVAHAYRGDGQQRRTWVGCRRLNESEVLLLGDTVDSFDGRYWGPTSVALIEGVWRKL